jgi:hypothetical protein
MDSSLEAENDVRTLRTKHLKQEACVQSIGYFYMIMGGILVLATVARLLMPPGPDNLRIPLACFIAVVAAALFWTGTLLRKLDSRGKLPATILSTLAIAAGLLRLSLFGVGINAYILYLLHCDESKVVFSEEYKSVIAATPEIRYRLNPVVMWLAIFTLILVAIVAIIVTVHNHLSP